MKYHVVTVTEGGAHFATYETLSEFLEDYAKEIRAAKKTKEMLELRVGDCAIVDGCSIVYVLNDDAKTEAW